MNPEEMADAIIQTIHGEIVAIPSFEYIGTFLTRDDVPRGRKGLYVFAAIDEIPLTREMITRYNAALNWDNSGVGAPFNLPYPERINPGDVFYLGKASGKQDSVYQRLRVHFGDRTDSATNGIKMKMPERNFVDGKLTVHIFFFEKNNPDWYIIDAVEKLLHQKLRPITGKS